MWTCGKIGVAHVLIFCNTSIIFSFKPLLNCKNWSFSLTQHEIKGSTKDTKDIKLIKNILSLYGTKKWQRIYNSHRT